MINSRIWTQEIDARAYWDICGSFGQLTGTVTRGNGTLECSNEAIRVTCAYEITPQGVTCRRDTVENISSAPIRLTCLKSRFLLDGGEYEAYTQHNNSMCESVGQWQTLVTGVSAFSSNIRSSQTATPMLALWNLQSCRGAAFHMLPFCAWEITATRIPVATKYTRILVELGVRSRDLDLELAPGEAYTLPEILCYGFLDKVGMDCWKLHRYMHARYPRKQLPMLFNSWLCRFDKITYENLACQIAPAKELGLEYFVIDAGWFGNGDSWFTSVGDWEENTTGALRGRMGRLADEIRQAGMKFGLWIEPERADPQSNAVRDHREFYIRGRDFYFLNFAVPEARAWALDLIGNLIRRYGVEFIKFDLNADLCFDSTHTGFIRYFEGYRCFIRQLRQRFPELYLCGCSGGGGRMQLAGCTMFDGFWPSDNESPYEEMRIYKDSIRRLPPQVFENWAVVRSIGSIISYDGPPAEKLLACNDSTWNDVAGVHMSFLKGYLSGGPIGLSFDLLALSDSVREQLKAHIAQAKQQRDFWLRAECHILSDTPTLLVLQYCDESLKKSVIQAFSLNAYQDRVTVYPAVDPARTYHLEDGTAMSGHEIAENGIPLPLADWKEMSQLILEAE